MKFVFILVYFLTIFKHDVPVASYNITVEDFDIEINTEFHTIDLENVFGIIEFETLTKYLKEKSTWKINNKKVELMFCDIYHDEFHSTISSNIFFDEKIKSIEILNQTFLNEILNFSNVYYIHQSHKKVRGFRSHKNRSAIKIDL